MNIQCKYRNGLLISRGIEWTDATCTPIAGCKHKCRWLMPDGKIAKCYAETCAEGLASKAYPNGFAFHYWHPERLDEPLKVEKSLKIFIDSMSDFGAHWVPREQRLRVIDVMEKASWHTFQTLTKNPKGLLGYDFPPNVWVGFSTPPDYMWGHRLNEEQRIHKLEIDLLTMREIHASIKWVSIEPLSWDVAPHFEDCGLDWAVIGAASDGRIKHQPEQEHLHSILSTLDRQSVPIFMKGNLKHSPHREEFPGICKQKR
jgi:protein gp37